MLGVGAEGKGDMVGVRVLAGAEAEGMGVRSGVLGRRGGGGCELWWFLGMGWRGGRRCVSFFLRCLCGCMSEIMRGFLWIGWVDGEGVGGDKGRGKGSGKIGRGTGESMSSVTSYLCMSIRLPNVSDGLITGIPYAVKHVVFA